MFRDREEAGLCLAEKLKDRSLHDPLVLAIPRGGVVVGAALAKELRADLDIVLSRKLRAPGQPEVALGAISEAGHTYWNPCVSGLADNLEEYLDEECQTQKAEIDRYRRLVRAVRPAANIEGRSVILTDDGIATGSTVVAALEVIEAHKPQEILVAVPVAAPQRLGEIRHWCDELICLIAPRDFVSVGQFYWYFPPVEDAQVLELLRTWAAKKVRGSAQVAVLA
jgi:predicted phosphoribosyltransferase